MEKVYSIQNLDCANCAVKVETALNALPEVEKAVIIFATMQLRLTAGSPDAVLPAVLQAARKIEPDIDFVSSAEHHSHCSSQTCHCHEHGHPHTHTHTHCERKKASGLAGILWGAGLFLLGVLLDILLPSHWNLPAFFTAYLLLGWNVLHTAGKNLIRGKVFDENFLMTIATIGAFVIGELAEAVGVMLFFRIGEFFEHQAMERSRSQITEALDMRPETVTLAEGRTVPAGSVQPGMLFIVRPGDRIPLDATVVQGQGHLDTAAITGESLPVSVELGSSVLSGCVNCDALLTLRCEKPLSESMVTRILESVGSAAASKPKIDRFLTRFARIYTPAVVCFALATAILPSLIWGDWGYWVYTALSFLVMSCPCALVLSVPLAYFCGIGAGSKKGILFKGGASMEAIAGIKAVVLDKTGTVTKGDFTVQKVAGSGDVLQLCAACEQFSSHPIGKRIVAAAQEAGLSFPQISQVEEISGEGIRAVLEGKEVLCGNKKLLERFHVATDHLPSEEYGTQVFVAANGAFIGYLLIADTVKEDAAPAIARLHRQGLFTAMLTGDRQESAHSVGTTVGMDEIHAQLLPHEKLTALQKIRTQHGSVLFVGDGINDAPVLAGADVGAAMGSGADAAVEAADMVFLTGQVSAIADALELAKSTRRIALQNVIFALTVKAAVMMLGLLGYSSMWAAVFADSGVAMLCILNAVRLLYRRFK